MAVFEGSRGVASDSAETSWLLLRPPLVCTILVVAPVHTCVSTILCHLITHIFTLTDWEGLTPKLSLQQAASPPVSHPLPSLPAPWWPLFKPKFLKILSFIRLYTCDYLAYNAWRQVPFDPLNLHACLLHGALGSPRGGAVSCIPSVLHCTGIPVCWLAGMHKGTVAG